MLRISGRNSNFLKNETTKRWKNYVNKLVIRFKVDLGDLSNSTDYEIFNYATRILVMEVRDS